MSGSNRVNVTIFRREYTVSGSKPRDYIVKVADYVDGVMTDISEQTSGISPSSLAVLSAVNIADEFFEAKDEIASKDGEKEQLEKDVAHYTQLWEEAKRNFLQHKEDSQAFAEQMAGIQEKLNEKAIENDRLLKAAAEKDRLLEKLAEDKKNALADAAEKGVRRIEEIISEKDAIIEKLTHSKDARIEELTREKDERIEKLNVELNRRVASVTDAKDARVDELTRERNQRIASITAEKDARIEALSDQVTDLTAKLQEWNEHHDVTPDQIRELSDKYKELEGNYFEVQMENIRLKGEIERLNSMISE